MGAVVERFPLFPLGIVLLPSESVPLHIFEQRYKTMIGECLEREREFGIVWLSDDGLREVGCAARIETVLERFDDGRLNIAVRGTRAFRLLRRIDELPYPAGDVEPLEDVPAGPDRAAGERARERYADLVEHATDERPSPEELAPLGAYELAAQVELALAEKQRLLELRSEDERMSALAGILAGALTRFERATRIAERARSNGHGR